MCRLLGYVSRKAVAVRDILPGPDFGQFVDLSRLHGDGWGMAWADDGQLRHVAAPTAAVADPEFDRLCGRPLGAAGLTHLRWATDGLAVLPANTHPFVADGIALAHNGSISPIPALDELLSDRSREALSGTTDSERYFRLVLEHVERTGDTVGGVIAAVEQLSTVFPAASLNAIILDTDTLIAVHISAAATPPLGELAERYPDPEQAPADHCDRYFRLRYRTDEQSVVVASTGVTGPGWHEVPADSVMEVDRRSLVVRHHPLRTLHSAAAG